MVWFARDAGKVPRLRVCTLWRAAAAAATAPKKGVAHSLTSLSAPPLFLPLQFFWFFFYFFLTLWYFTCLGIAAVNLTPAVPLANIASSFCFVSARSRGGGSPRVLCVLLLHSRCLAHPGDFTPAPIWPLQGFWNLLSGFLIPIPQMPARAGAGEGPCGERQRWSRQALGQGARLPQPPCPPPCNPQGWWVWAAWLNPVMWSIYALVITQLGSFSDEYITSELPPRRAAWQVRARHGQWCRLCLRSSPAARVLLPQTWRASPSRSPTSCPTASSSGHR